ncbi:MAG: hypothetical protein IPG47_03410 [Thermoflexaceae bacterium]|nr:hypothetical protein [Thermoflexaceae bacterium]
MTEAQVEDEAAMLRAQLRSLRAEFDQFRDHLPDALVEADIATTRLTYLNHMATLLFGYTPEDVAAGLEGTRLLGPEAAARVLREVEHYTAESLRTGTPYERSWGPRFDGIGRHVTDLAESFPEYAELLGALMPGGAVTPRFSIGTHTVLDVRAEPVNPESPEADGIVGVAVDVTELVRAEAALRQSQKLESLGQLAGGVAHDFNNVLASVLGVATMLKRSPGIPESDRESLEIIETAALRGAEISGRLLAFARGGERPFQPTDLRAVLREVHGLAHHTMGPGVTIRMERPATEIVVRGDAGQLSQALLNLVLNARDAMPGGGVITLAATVEEGDAVVRVADTGTGMTAATAARVYEPFFTTKPTGSGTGLGAAIVWRIVQAHGGTIGLQTAPGEGTVFTIRIPVYKVDVV